MKSRVLATAVGLAALVSSVAFAADAKDCRHFRAVGSGITQSIASLMATQGAINLAENRGYTVQGEAKLVSCTAAGTFGNECAATSYACKLPH
jgi:ABC-type proline/glycine betaine transport system substrate-binding protein